MTIDLPTAISILGALVSIGMSVGVAWARLTAIDVINLSIGLMRKHGIT